MQDKVEGDSTGLGLETAFHSGLPLTGCMMLSKSRNFSESQFIQMQC